MTDPLHVAIEIGPKGKKVVAVARDWPGFARGAANEDLAVARLLQYLPRYARVASRAGLGFDPGAVAVTERYTGTGSTDFWGISFAPSEFDQQAISSEELERELSLLQASWAEFDGIRGRVTPEMRKGPRGGGRDRDHIVRHTIGVEYDYRHRLGIEVAETIPLAADALKAHRESYVAAFRARHTEGQGAGRGPLRYLLRHSAFHTLDHAWEMEDKDLSE